MQPLATPDQFPVLALLGGGVQEAGEQGQRHRQLAAIVQYDPEGIGRPGHVEQHDSPGQYEVHGNHGWSPYCASAKTSAARAMRAKRPCSTSSVASRISACV